MTDVSTNHPSGLPLIELKEEGRQISFRRDCLGEIRISRQVNDGEWELLIEQTRSPYTDTDAFDPGTKLTYAIVLELNGQKHEYTLDVRL